MTLLAIFIGLLWTAPSPQAQSYEARMGNAVAGWSAVTLKSAPNAGALALQPGAPGSTERAWVSVPTDSSAPYGWYNGGAAIEVRYHASNGKWAAWSNVGVVAAGVPDVAFVDGACCWRTGNGIEWPKPDSLSPGVRVVRFSRCPGDTTIVGPRGPLLRWGDWIGSGARSALCMICDYWRLNVATQGR